MTKLDLHVRSKIKLEYEVMHGYAYVEDMNTCIYTALYIFADKIHSTLGR